MAFQRIKYEDFLKMIKIVQGYDFECQTIAQNFILEERLTEEREDSYAHYVASPQDMNDWVSGHENYLSDKIKLLQSQGTPETFTNLNKPNLLPEIEQDQFLIRVENLTQLAKIAQYDNDITLLIDYITIFLEDSTDQDATDVVEDFLYDCNGKRDFRPTFVGFWGEVKDLLDGNDEYWPNKLRDRFGLGHFDPMDGEPIPVLILRYRVADVVAAQTEDRNFTAIPTVLDSSMNPFFCPTPKQGWNEGQTLDLTSGTENDYAFNCEILHRYLEYKASYIYRFGWITESPGKTLEEARRIHLECLQDDFKYFDLL